MKTSKFLQQGDAAHRLTKAILDNLPPNAIVRGDEVLVLDMAQVEARIAATFSTTAGDPHAEKAAEVLGKPVSEITPEDRRVGKAANLYEMYSGRARK